MQATLKQVSQSGVCYFHDTVNDYYTIEHPLTQRYLKVGGVCGVRERKGLDTRTRNCEHPLEHDIDNSSQNPLDK